MTSFCWDSTSFEYTSPGAPIYVVDKTFQLVIPESTTIIKMLSFVIFSVEKIVILIK